MVCFVHEHEMVFNKNTPYLNKYNKKKKEIYFLALFYAVIIDIIKLRFKDARSVSLYPYNQSQILQWVKYTK